MTTSDGRNISMLDVSASGVSIAASRDAISTLQRATIHLGPSSFTTELDVVRLDPTPADHLRVGSRFRNLSKNAQQALSSFLVRGFLAQNSLPKRLSDGRAPSLVWTRAEQIGALLRPMLVKGTLSAYAESNSPAFQLRLAAVVRDGSRCSLVGEVIGQSVPPAIGTECLLVAASKGSLYYFRSEITSDDETTIRLSFPEELEQTGFRDSVRSRLPADSGHFVCLADDGHARPIADVGARGLSFHISRADSVSPGQRLSLQLRIDGREILVTSIVRGISPLRRWDHYLCGVELLSFDSAEDERRWNRFVFRTTHPNLTLDAPGSIAVSWRILGSSDYLSEWTPLEQRLRIARSFRKDWGQTTEHDGHIIVLNREDRSIGTIAGNRLYPRSWMVHHLGIDRDERAPDKREQFFDVLRELYSGFSYLVQHVAGAEYFTVYFERGKRWNDLMYGDFVESYSNKTGSLMTKNVVYRHVDRPTAPMRFAGIKVVKAGRAGLRKFAQRLGTVLSPTEIDAFSYRSDEIGLKDFTADCAGGGYERTRTVYLAKRGTEVVAGLIAETGGEGLNVFGMMNSCRIVNLDPNNELDPEIKLALLQAAVRCYRKAGKSQFIFFDDCERDSANIEQLGFEQVSLGIRWIMKRDTIPGWLSYTNDILRINADNRKRVSRDYESTLLRASA